MVTQNPTKEFEQKNANELRDWMIEDINMKKTTNRSKGLQWRKAALLHFVVEDIE